MRLPDAQPWSKAAAQIWALVSGLPGEKRRKRQLLMLQAFFDDSRMDPAGNTVGAFAMAGYVADATQWALFAGAWQSVLDLPSPRGLPQLKYLKTADAYRLRNRNSSFHGWTEAERDERLLLFARTVNAHAMTSFQCLVPVETFRSVFGDLAETFRPFAFTFYSLTMQMGKLLVEKNINDKVEIYFDTVGDESQDKLRELWRELIPTLPAKYQEKFAGEPDFKKDDEVLPLQAADLNAWHTRANIRDLTTGGRQDTEWTNVVWKELLKLERRTALFTEEKLRALKEWPKNNLSAV